MPERDNTVLSKEQETLSKSLMSRAMCWIPAWRKLVAMFLWISKKTGCYILSLGTEWKELFQWWVDFFQEMPNNKHGREQVVMLWKYPEGKCRNRCWFSLSIPCWGKSAILSLFLSHWVFLPQKTEGFHAHSVKRSRSNMYHFVTAGSYQILYNPGSSENQETW